LRIPVVRHVTAADPVPHIQEQIPVFSRLGTWCHDHRRLVLGLWVAVVVLGFAVAGVAGSAFRDEFNLPDVESRQGFDILDEHFGGQGTGAVGTIVFVADQGVDDAQVRAGMQDLFAEVADIPDVVRVQSPYDEGNEGQISSGATARTASPTPTSSSPTTST
jgi:RND superfamily putative drug exporter